MSLFSKSNAHCEVAEVLIMPKNTILRLIDVLRSIITDGTGHAENGWPTVMAKDGIVEFVERLSLYNGLFGFCQRRDAHFLFLPE